jgi:ornithine decarboxylase
MATALTDTFTAVDLTKHHLLKKRLSVSEHHHGGLTPRQLIGDALRTRVESVDHEFCEPGEEDTFFVADLGEIYRQHMRWKLNLPRVKPFYGEQHHSLWYLLLFFVQ